MSEELKTEADPLNPQPTEIPRDDKGRFLPSSPEPVTQASVQPKHPAYLVNQAKQFGFSDEEIEEFSQNQLGNTMWRLQQRQEAMRDQSARDRAIVDPPTRQAPPPAPEPEENLTDEGWDPELNKRFKILQDQRKEMAALKAEIATLKESDKRRVISDEARIIDQCFEKLGADYESVFGKGSIQDLAPESPERVRRQAAHLAAIQSNDGSYLSRLHKTAKLMFPPKAKEVAKPANEYETPPTNGVKPRITQEEWDDAALAKPTARKATELPHGEERARRNLAKKLAEQEAVKSDSGVSLDDFFAK